MELSNILAVGLAGVAGYLGYSTGGWRGLLAVVLGQVSMTL